MGVAIPGKAVKRPSSLCRRYRIFINAECRRERRCGEAGRERETEPLAYVSLWHRYDTWGYTKDVLFHAGDRTILHPCTWDRGEKTTTSTLEHEIWKKNVHQYLTMVKSKEEERGSCVLISAGQTRPLSSNVTLLRIQRCPPLSREESGRSSPTDRLR